MDSATTVLIAAASGRALAASARRAGYAPLVADFFGDQDTIAAADAHVRIEPGRGLNADALLTAFEALSAARDPCGAVYGTGFEDRPDLLARIAQRWHLVGNGAQTVARIKDPLAFAGICRGAGIAHPETSLARPADISGWLAKRIGGAGGTHIRPALDHTDGTDFYFQRRVAGVPVSALVMANGRHAIVLGFSMQWPSPSPRQPFRYGGAARPAMLARETQAAMAAAVERLVAAIPLVGLNSADFVVDGDDFHLLEINPRPGATFDIFEPRRGSLFALHIAACRGMLPAVPPIYDDAAAGATVYADCDIAAMPTLDWPDWTADRPIPGSSVKAEAPLCTVIAAAASVAQAKLLVERRTATILATLRARVS